MDVTIKRPQTSSTRPAPGARRRRRRAPAPSRVAAMRARARGAIARASTSTSAPARATRRRRRAAATPRRGRRDIARALFESVPTGNPGTDPSDWGLFAAASVGTFRDATALVATALGVSASVDAQREKKIREDEDVRREYGFDLPSASGDGGGSIGSGDGRGWGGDDGDWGSDDRRSRLRRFVWVRGGRNGFKWLAMFLLCAWWCYFITDDPYMGTLWLACAIACGWGVFVIAGAVFVAAFLANFVLQQYLVDKLDDVHGEEKLGFFDSLFNNKRAVDNIKSGRYSKTIPEYIMESENRNKHLNPNLPQDVNIVGTDTQIAQIKLSPGEEVAASPGAMCYMSSNVMSVTSLGPGGLPRAIMRALAGEPFFLNTFKNLGVTEGYIAVGGLEPSDKIAVIELKDEIKHDILCARDSYMCSKGNVRITAAAALRSGVDDFDSFSDMLKYRIGLAARLVLSKGNSIFNGEWLTGSGTVCITGKGTVVRRTLKKDEELVVDARSVMALERSVGYELEVQNSPLAAVFGGAGLFFVRLQGPGTFYLQSLPVQKQLDSGFRLGGRKLKVKTQ